MTTEPTPAKVRLSDQLGHDALKPRAWLCELAQENGTTRTQFVEEDPDGLRWNDAGEPSPYRTTPLFDAGAMAQLHVAIAAAIATERKRCASLCMQTGELASDMYGDGAECLQTASMCAAAILGA